MTRTIALIAVAGIAGSAAAQSFSLSNDADPAGVLPGTVVTITMSFDPGAPNQVLAAGFWRFTNNGAAGTAEAGTWLFPGAFTEGGEPQPGGSLGGASAASRVRYLQFPYDALAQGPVFQYSFTAGDEGTVVIDLDTVQTSWGEFGTATASNTFAFGGTSTSFEVVPTPGSAAVLGLGGLLAARRRR